MYSEDQLTDAHEKLKGLYASLPETQGCMKHINLPEWEGGCSGWCCSLQNPSVLYVEFLLSWRRVLKEWDDKDICNLVRAAISNYVHSEKPTKSCIFWDKKTKLCKQHETRPLACRMYGITPEEEFKPKYEKLKVLYADVPGADIRDQCKLVSTRSGKPVTKEQSDAWWEELKDIEAMLGIDREEMSDAPGGTYRTYHDHLLLQVCPDGTMRQLQALRLYGSPSDKEEGVLSFIAAFRRAITSMTEAREKKGENDVQEENTDS